MKVSRIRALRGPNLWSRHTALEAIVACSPEERCIDQNLPGFEVRLRALFPCMGPLRETGHTGPLSLAHVLEAATLALQEAAGCPVTFSHTAVTLETGTYQVIVEYSEEAVGRLALELAQALIQAALSGAATASTSAPLSASSASEAADSATAAAPASEAADSAHSANAAADLETAPADTAFDLEAALAQLRDLDEDERMGPSTGAIVEAAVARGIPFRRLTKGSMVQFGWGSRQRRIQAAELDSTSAVAESIAQDKDLTKKLLRAAGVPVPWGRPASDADDAWAAAQQIGLPVVLKPQDGNQGKGVTVNITSREQLDAAFRAAAEHGEVMVEKFLPGSDFRLLVVGNKLVAAARREPPQVVGDGTHTVRELVDLVNLDPKRGSGHATSLTKIRFDDIAVARLEAQNLTPASVPPKGQRVILRNNANLSTGGTATDVTDEVHPEVAARAVAAAQMIGLHICGVDVVCESMRRPLEAQSGGVVEVNAAPGLRMHLAPSYGKGRAVGAAMIDELFPTGDNGRVPVIAVTGTNGKTTTARLIAHLLTAQGLRTGMTNTDGVYINGRQTDSGDCSGPKSARNVLMHPDVDAAVFEVARGGVLREGLGFDCCEVAVVTNIGSGDHLGLNYITTVEDLAVLKRVIVQNVAPTGYAVLNAADAIVNDMAKACPGKVIFFTADRHHPLMATHRAQGKRTVYVDGAMLVACEGSWVERIALASIPLTRGGTIGFQVENVMAAVAAAWAANLSWETIKSGLASFVNDAHNAPGRFNVMDYAGATVIADYGHNPDAMRALVEAVNAMPAQRRSVVISGAGDRRDSDIRDQTVILGAAFDDVILYQDAAQRGRADGEVMALLREGLKDASRTTQIDEIRGEFIAIDTALARLQPGDLCLILVDQVQEALDHLAGRIASASAQRLEP